MQAMTKFSRNTVKTVLTTLFMSGALGLAAGCSTLPDLEAKPPALPSDWLDAPAPQQAEDMTDWWTRANDPFLSQLIEEGLEAGPSVRVAALRMQEARALSRVTVADYLPIIGLGATGNYTRSLDGPRLVGSFQGFVAGGGQGNIVQENQQMTGFYGPRISWEIPLWSRIEAAAVGTRANIAFARADIDATRAALAADIAQAYVDYRTSYERVLALREAADIGRELARLSQISADAGFLAPAEAADAVRLAETLQARVPDAEVAARQFAGVLALLRGKAPGTDDPKIIAALLERKAIPIAAVPGALAKPADLLRLRPDIAQAEAQAVLAGVELGIARADLLPRLQLGGQLGVGSNLIGSGLPETLTQFELTPQITMPLLGWGRARANISRNSARFQQALINYESAVNQASAEASGAIVSWTQGEKRLASARAAEAAAEKTASGVRASQSAGIASLTDRLRADQQLIDARLNRISAEREAASAAILMYRSFGGGPARVDRLGRPPAQAEAEMSTTPATTVAAPASPSVQTQPGDITPYLTPELTSRMPDAGAAPTIAAAPSAHAIDEAAAMRARIEGATWGAAAPIDHASAPAPITVAPAVAAAPKQAPKRAMPQRAAGRP
jgi:NodT family efflux transporter outer membrane factor (OMF) lipoprotein